MSKVLKLTTDGNVQEMSINPENWQELHDSLDGYPCIVRTHHIYKFCGVNVVMIVNNDGYSKNLEVNHVASLMYLPGMIAGDVLFCKEIDTELEGFEDEEVELLKDKFIDLCECTDEYKE